MNNFIFQHHTDVVFGQGCVKEYLASFVEPYGPHVLLACGGGWVKRSGVYDQVYRILRKTGKQVTELSGILPGPTLSKVQEGARMARESHADLLLAVGSGSVVDCCKAVSLAAVSGGDLWEDFWARQGVVDFDPLPLGAVVTAPGAGSGMNGRAVLTNETLGVTIGRDYPQCGPRFTLMDPSYTASVPRSRLISGGFDALSRLIELYFSPPDRETVTDDLAEALMRGMVRDLRAVAEAPEDDNARSNLMWETALAGDKLLQLGKHAAFPCRQLARRLERCTGRPFAVCLAVLQPRCLRQACLRDPHRFARFALRVWDLSPEGRTAEELALAGLEALAEFIRALGFPAALHGTGELPPEVLAAAAGEPVPPFSGEEVLALLQACLSGVAER